MVYLFLLMIVIIIYIIIEVATEVLEATGLSRELAKFQAISMLTGTGFTTTEAEMVTKHPVRRRMAQYMIIFGLLSFAVLVAIVTTIINQEFSLDQTLFGLLMVSTLFLIFRTKRARRFLLKGMSIDLDKNMSIQELYHLGDHEIVTKLHLEERHSFLYCSLKESNLGKHFGIYVLSVKRSWLKDGIMHQKWIRYPTGSVRLQKGDELLICGDKRVIHEMFHTSQ